MRGSSASVAATAVPVSSAMVPSIQEIAPWDHFMAGDVVGADGGQGSARDVEVEKISDFDDESD